MKSPLFRNMVISATVHLFLVATIIFSSFLSRHARRQRREITTFVDLQMMSREEIIPPAPALQDIPEPAPEPIMQKPREPPKKKTIDVNRKLIKRETSLAKKNLTEKQIREMLRVIRPSGRQDVVLSEFDRYLAEVHAVMYTTWKQPGALSGASGLVTRARIRVQRDGRIIQREITDLAGNELMDMSVATALEAVKDLPELPQECGDYEDITIDFELTDRGR